MDRLGQCLKGAWSPPEQSRSANDVAAADLSKRRTDLFLSRMVNGVCRRADVQAAEGWLLENKNSGGSFRETQEIASVNNRYLVSNPFLVLLGFLGTSTVFGSFVASADTTHKDIVDFFQKAVSSPPDVEYYLVQRHQLRTRRVETAEIKPPAPQFWHGARSGTNYFLSAAGNGNEPLDMLASPLVVGRHGDTAYQLSANAITLSHDQPGKFSNHPLNGAGRGFYALVNQDLNMGLGAIADVVWNGNSFRGLLNGNAVYGELSLSNGLPCLTRVSLRKDSSPFKSCTYSYPAPPSAFGGFPEKVVISTLLEGDLRPYLEITFLKLRLAKSDLPENFFSETHFVTTNIVHKNIISNAEVMTVLPNGQFVKLGPLVKRLPSTKRSGVAKSIVLGVLFVSAVACVIYIWKSRTQ